MAKGGYRGGMPMGGRNQMQMMKQAQKMQENLMKMQEELQAKEYEATAGGGVSLSRSPSIPKQSIRKMWKCCRI
mgnify:CR=1 FL=1